MNNLFTFGCSYTENFEPPNGSYIYQKYKKFRGGNFPPVWPEILSEKLNLNLVNYAIGGCGNDLIFQTFCKHLDEYNKKDLIIIEWTYNERFKWANIDKYEWLHLNYDSGQPDINIKTSKDIAVNRSNSIYIEDILNYEKIINKISKYIGFKVYYWCADFKISHTLQNKTNKMTDYLCNENIGKNETIFSEIFRRNGLRIKEETNDIINDIHMGESGHRVQAELFYDYIIKNQPKLI
jgi:hypothetical protein